MKKLALLISVILYGLPGLAQNSIIEPSVTCLYATKDSTDLYMDLYYPEDGSEGKATIIFAFGGGFKFGHKREEKALKWFRHLTSDGFTVAAIDYRLGLKDFKVTGISKALIDALEKSISMATEDLLCATDFLIRNREMLGIDTSRIIAGGTSAGAITALQAEWEICNGTEAASILPEGFNYAGVISWSGAIYNRKGGPVYEKAPCPTVFFHGMKDNIVTYNKIQLGKRYFGGTGALTKQYEKSGFNYNVYRYPDRGHEVAGTMESSYFEVMRFIESNVLQGERRIVDAIVTDPTLVVPDWAKNGLKGLMN